MKEAERKIKSADWLERKKGIILASECLKTSASEQSLKLILSTTEDIHPRLRIEAIKALSNTYSQKIRNRIYSMSVQEKNNNVRWFALMALGRYRDAESADSFVAGLNSRDWLIREASIKGLFMIKDIPARRKHTRSIIKALKDRNQTVKISTLNNLNIKDKKIYFYLKKIIKNNKNTSNISLLKAALKAVNGYLMDKETRTTVIGFLYHSNSDIRVLALRALKKDQKIRNIQIKPAVTDIYK